MAETMNFYQIVAQAATREVRVEVTKGPSQTRYDVFIPNNGQPVGETAVREHAVKAGATGHLTFFAPRTIMGDVLV